MTRLLLAVLAGFAGGCLGFLALFVPMTRTVTRAHWLWLAGRPSSYTDLSQVRKP